MLNLLKSYIRKFPERKKSVLGLLISLFFAVFLSLLYILGVFSSLQLVASDFLSVNFTTETKESDIVYLLITDATIIEADEVDGIQWPWPRQAYGEAIKFLNNAGARAIVFDVVFSETSREGPEDDDAFAVQIGAGNVILANLSTNHQGNASQKKITRNLELMSTHALSVIVKDFNRPIKEYKYFRPPVEPLFIAAEKVGDAKFLSDSDGIGRRASLLIKSEGKYYPSLSLSVALKVLGVKKILLTGNEIILSGDKSVRKIPLDKDGMTWLKYYGDSSVYPKYLLLRVIKSQVRIEEGEAPYYDPALFKDKIVIIASDATELKDLRPNPFNKYNDPGAHYHGTAIDNILKGDFLKAYFDPAQVVPAVFALSILTAFLTGSFNAYLGFTFVSILLLINAGTVIFLFHYYNIIIDLSVSSICIIGSFSLTSIVNHFVEAQQKFFITNAFGQYLSPTVIQQLVKDPSKLKLGGEMRVMTAYFSDIAGFSTISEKLSPQELVALLNDYLSQMCEIIGKYNGTVDKFEGDAIIAFWGAPIPTEEHALLACKASLEMNNKIVERRKKNKKECKEELYVRMGLSSGPMVVGNMGSKQRMDYTIMGDSVNLAARLEGANKFYRTYLMISEFTYKFVEDEVEARELDIIRVVGKNKPVRVYELLSLKGELPEIKENGLKAFKHAVELYRNQQFQEAIKGFEKVFSFIPDDPPTQVYLKRCARFSETKPPRDWDGVYQLTSKG